MGTIATYTVEGRTVSEVELVAPKVWRTTIYFDDGTEESWRWSDLEMAMGEAAQAAELAEDGRLDEMKDPEDEPEPTAEERYEAWVDHQIDLARDAELFDE